MLFSGVDVFSALNLVSVVGIPLVVWYVVCRASGGDLRKIIHQKHFSQYVEHSKSLMLSIYYSYLLILNSLFLLCIPVLTDEENRV